jgi:hypothetical protein
VVKAAWPSRCRLDGAQVLGSRLAASAVCDDVEGHLLAFAKAAHAGAFDRADMNEDILAAVLRLNEAEALLAVEPLYSSPDHGSSSSSYVCIRSRAVAQPVISRFWGEVVSQPRSSRRGHVVRPHLDGCKMVMISLFCKRRSWLHGNGYLGSADGLVHSAVA